MMDPFLGSSLAKAAAKRQIRPLPRCKFQQHASVSFPAAISEQAKNGFVAGKLQIAVCRVNHQPNQRIEPMDAERRCQQPLSQTVERPDMHEFVCENVHSPPRICFQMLRQHNHRPAKPVGKRGVRIIQ